VYNHRPTPTHQQQTYQQSLLRTELCSIATDDMSLSNELQNAISEVSGVQTSTSKTAKEVAKTAKTAKENLGSLHKVLYVPYSQNQDTVKEYFL
jgi:hypothetical protein